MKRTIKKFIILLFFTTLPTMVCSEDPLNLRILHFNDVYEVAPQTDPLEEQFAGFAELKTKIDQKKNEAENCLITFGGDLLPATIQGAPLPYSDKIKFMNQLGIDAAVLGNHEFDYGSADTLKIIALSEFPWIVDNIEYNGEPHFGKTIPYKIFSFGDYKIAVIGYILPETKELSNPGPKINFLNPIAKAKPLVSRLKEEGIDIIIALTHQTLKEDQNLLKAIPEIDLVLGGHEHRPITYFINQKQMIFKAGYDARFLGLIDLKIERYTNHEGTHVFIAPSWEMIPIQNIKPDPTLQKLIQSQKNEIPKQFFEPLAKTEIPLDSRRAMLYSQQTSMGTLITTALKKELNTDIAIINSGSIRGNHLYPKGTSLSRQNIHKELPFEDDVVVCHISGAQLKEWIGNSLDNTGDSNGSFLQMAGLTYSITPKSVKGNHGHNIRIAGEPIDSQKNYTLATVDYLVSGKHGLTKLYDIKKTTHQPSQIVIKYLEKIKNVTKEDLN